MQGILRPFGSGVPRPGALWVKGSDPNGNGSPPADGTLMSSWYDFSALATNETNGGGAVRPTYHDTTAGGQNNQGYAQFAGGQSFSRSATAVDIAYFFMVVTLNKSATFDFLIDSGTQFSLSRFEMYTGTTGLTIGRDGGGGTIIWPAINYVDGSTHLVTAVFAGAASEIRVDGTQVATGSLNGTSAPTAEICIGRNIINSGNFLTGKVYEAMVYTVADALTGAQVTTIQNYLLAKFALP